MNPRAFADIVEVIQLPNWLLRFVRDNGQKLANAEPYCVAGYRTTLKLRSVTVSVVVAAICPWNASIIGYDSASYAFNTLAATPITVPQLCTDN
jgi:hypothetical protein